MSPNYDQEKEAKKSEDFRKEIMGSLSPATGSARASESSPKHKNMDQIIARIEHLSKIAGLERETITLLKMAAEAQRTGKMPPLPITMQPLPPTHFHDCTAPTNGVGKITAPQLIG